MPTLVGFQWFIANIMVINTVVLPTTEPVIAWVYQQAVDTVNLQLAQAAPTIYEQAVYNLAGDMIINYAQDQTEQTYFSDLRAQLHINDFVAGVVQSTSDESTSTSLEIAEFYKNLTLGDLQNLKTVYGRTYLALAQKVGTLWGIS